MKSIRLSLLVLFLSVSVAAPGQAQPLASSPAGTTGVDTAGYDRPPIVFVPGWNGLSTSCDGVEPDEYFGQIDDLLQEDGYYVSYA